jgi:hypothetical protein
MYAILGCMDSTSTYTTYFHVPFSSPIHFTLKMEAAQPSEMLVFYHITTWCHNLEDYDLVCLFLPVGGFIPEKPAANKGVSKSFRTESVTQYMLTFGITCWEATQRVMAAKLTRLTHRIVIQLHLVAESCTICSSRSRWPVRKLLDTPLYIDHLCFSPQSRLGMSHHDILINKVTGWRLNSQGLIPGRENCFSLCHLVQTWPRGPPSHLSNG